MNVHTSCFAVEGSWWGGTFTAPFTVLRCMIFSSMHLLYKNLQSLPQGLHRLPSLRNLEIYGCKKIQSLPPKEGLPTSLETLRVVYCGPELTEQAEKLRGADPYFSALISVFKRNR